MRRFIICFIPFLLLLLLAERGLALSCAPAPARFFFGCDETECHGFVAGTGIVDGPCGQLPQVVALPTASLGLLHQHLSSQSASVAPVGVWRFASTAECYYVLDPYSGRQPNQDALNSYCAVDAGDENLEILATTFDEIMLAERRENQLAKVAEARATAKRRSAQLNSFLVILCLVPLVGLGLLFAIALRFIWHRKGQPAPP